MRYHRLLTSIGATTLKTHSLGTPWTTRRRLIAAVEPLWALQTAALRDRALITLSFLAALTNAEAAALNVHDVRITPGGLVVNLPFRPTPQVGLPTGQDSKFCPVVAWTAWLNRYDADGPLPAFPRLRPMGMRISGDPLTATGLSDVVKDRCERAGLEGAFTFSSLRTGFIRTAIRADLPAALIAQHTGLRQVRTIDYERDREHILDGGAATLIGL
jgi:integrase